MVDVKSSLFLRMFMSDLTIVDHADCPLRLGCSQHPHS